ADSEVSRGLESVQLLPDVCLSVESFLYQGSIFGPLLFIIYVNDLIRSCKTMFPLKFADYNKPRFGFFNKANGELLNISEWFKLNQLSLNVQKANNMIFSNKMNAFNLVNQKLNIDGIFINQVTQTKFLGEIVDQKL
uniref:Reverse transcriptase domain-containing protein n=1 Tax=Oryzias melastigma TaxID=30732 RepID=A0A3B3DIC3_ORYME